ncbi:conserved hypothetical protein [Ricinus communis]|uniref:RIN4 pathogenic type III effector avirulence factor Avr cleavage site domain-containing protein n=1 Tax=Ricinus communis TaxID=3988 RepID=B9S6S1_RICCO|nr:conserved hypothetical protein [Ricinus communis]
MATRDNGRPLPKFSELDDNPASAERYTVIFSKAMDEKKTYSATGNETPKNRGSKCKKPI